MDNDTKLYFKRGYKYQVSRDYHIKLDVVPRFALDLPFIKLDMKGNLVIKAGYAWNGASGPTWDSMSSMRGSLVHDLLYQLIRMQLIEYRYKEYADKLLHDLCTEDGMWKWRADYWRWAVLNLGAASCEIAAEPKEEVAP